MFAAMCITTAFGQAKINVAVYVHGTADEELKKVVAQRIIATMVRSNEYAVVERTSEFLAELKREQGYQYSGNVDDGQIIKLSKQFGVKLVCVADVQSPSSYRYLIATRMIDIETGLVVSANGEYDFYDDNYHYARSGYHFKNREKTLWRGNNKIEGLIDITNNIMTRLLQGVTTTKGKQKIAIYVTKSSDAYTAKCVSYRLIENITNSEVFITVDRTSDFQAELRYQGSGNVDDSQLSRLGRQFGVSLVCVIDITNIYTTMRIINVETGLIVATAENQSSSEVDKMTTELMQQLNACVKKDQKNIGSFIKCCEGLKNVNGVCRDFSSGIAYWVKSDLGIEVRLSDIETKKGEVVESTCKTCPDGWRMPTKAEFERMLTLKAELNFENHSYLTSDFRVEIVYDKESKSTIHYYNYYVWSTSGFSLKPLYYLSYPKKGNNPPPYYYSGYYIKCVKD